MTVEIRQDGGLWGDLKELRNASIGTFIRGPFVFPAMLLWRTLTGKLKAEGVTRFVNSALAATEKIPQTFQCQ